MVQIALPLPIHAVTHVPAVAGKRGQRVSHPGFELGADAVARCEPKRVTRGDRVAAGDEHQRERQERETRGRSRAGRQCGRDRESRPTSETADLLLTRMAERHRLSLPDVPDETAGSRRSVHNSAA